MISDEILRFVHHGIWIACGRFFSTVFIQESVQLRSPLCVSSADILFILKKGKAVITQNIQQTVKIRCQCARHVIKRHFGTQEEII